MDFLIFLKLVTVEQLLPDESSPTGKLHHFSKNVVTFELIMKFLCS